MLIYVYCREGLHRLSLRRSRFSFSRSNTMGKEDLDKVKEMNLAQKSVSRNTTESNPRPQMQRSNTVLDGSQSLGTLSRSKVVCRLV